MSDVRPNLLHCMSHAACLLAAAIVLAGPAGWAFAEGEGAAGPASLPASQPAAMSQPAAQPTSQPTTTSQLATGTPMRLLGGSDSNESIFGDSGVLWQMLAYVLVILVVGGVALVVMKRVMPKLATNSGKEMSLMETLHLGPRKTLHLVRIGSRRFLITAARDGVSVPTEVTSAFENILSSHLSPGQVEEDSPQ